MRDGTAFPYLRFPDRVYKTNRIFPTSFSAVTDTITVHSGGTCRISRKAGNSAPQKDNAYGILSKPPQVIFFDDYQKKAHTHFHFRLKKENKFQQNEKKQSTKESPFI